MSLAAPTVCEGLVTVASVYAYVRKSPEERAALGHPVLTMRYWPRGIAKAQIGTWIPDAGPSPDLLRLRKPKDGGAVPLPWAIFAERYVLEQQRAAACTVYTAGADSRPLVWRTSPVAGLRRAAHKHGAVCLLCCEGEANLCHRYILADLVRGLDPTQAVENAQARARALGKQ